jgi:hypothetical protein
MSKLSPTILAGVFAIVAAAISGFIGHYGISYPYDLLQKKTFYYKGEASDVTIYNNNKGNPPIFHRAQK